MSKLIVVVPMAGDGQRFKDAGYETPKPLIEVDGKPLFMHAVDSLKFTHLDDVEYVFMCREEHNVDNKLSEKISSCVKNSHVFYIKEKTRGSLETIMKALYAYETSLGIISDDTKILSIDCDFGFDCNTFIDIVEYQVTVSHFCHPCLMTFYAKDPKYSFVEPETIYGYAEPGAIYGTVKRTAEKIPISNYAIAGCYFLGNWGLLRQSYSQYEQDFTYGKIDIKELYVSNIYNYYRDKAEIVLFVDMNFHTDMLWSFNVPADLENYDKNKSIWDR